jgi:hypothetical protein
MIVGSLMITTVLVSIYLTFDSHLTSAAGSMLASAIGIGESSAETRATVVPSL